MKNLILSVIFIYLSPKIVPIYSQECKPGTKGCCNTMSALPPPQTSSCWDYWVPPVGGVIQPGSSHSEPKKGCDYKPCQDAVCACDSYCCDVAWDESCRGYNNHDGGDNNFFVSGCSAKLLCCEPEEIRPAPTIAPVSVPVTQCTSEKDTGCCDNIAAFPPPIDSSCWKYWVPPKGGIVIDGMQKPPLGCDYKPCEDAVCQCDSYCCDVAWDQSCRGYEQEDSNIGDSCSAKTLCCESKLFVDAINKTPASSKVVKFPVAAPHSVPVTVPVPSLEVIKVPIAVPYSVPVAVPVSSPKIIKVPVAVPYSVPVAVPVPSKKVIKVPIAAPVQAKYLNQCTSDTDARCCDNIAAFPPPIVSSCWKYWIPPKGGIATDGMQIPPLGCDYKPCEDAVCACDSYCCDVAWDQSCRGYEHEDSNVDNSCSAKSLCCESKLETDGINKTPAPSQVIKAPIAVPHSMPVAVPVPSSKVIKVPIAVPYSVPVAVPVSSPKIIKVPVAVPYSVPVAVPVPSKKIIKVPIAVPVANDQNKCTSDVDAGCCDSIAAFPPPVDSSCWKYWIPPKGGIATDGMQIPPLGCDYKPCEDAVCACDSYCCDVAWDQSCRGYEQEDSNIGNSCSAKSLCCESKLETDGINETPAPSQVIKVPVAAPHSLPETVPVPSSEVSKVPTAAPTELENTNECDSDADAGCCDNIGALPPPLDSSCWKSWKPPKGGIATNDMPDPQKGCDYKPCQDAVCACDSYCCDTAWDESCRGYQEGGVENYFVKGCSAKILCCESKPTVVVPTKSVTSPTIQVITEIPSVLLTSKPTVATAMPQATPTVALTAVTTLTPAKFTTASPTSFPTVSESVEMPTSLPVTMPTESPTVIPTSFLSPQATPTVIVPLTQTESNTEKPTLASSSSPSRTMLVPVKVPNTVTAVPQAKPTVIPSVAPTKSTENPTSNPTTLPSWLLSAPAFAPIEVPVIITTMPQGTPTTSLTAVTTAIPTELTSEKLPSTPRESDTMMPQTTSTKTSTESITAVPTVVLTEVPTVLVSNEIEKPHFENKSFTLTPTYELILIDVPSHVPSQTVVNKVPVAPNMKVSPKITIDTLAPTPQAIQVSTNAPSSTQVSAPVITAKVSPIIVEVPTISPGKDQIEPQIFRYKQTSRPKIDTRNKALVKSRIRCSCQKGKSIGKSNYYKTKSPKYDSFPTINVDLFDDKACSCPTNNSKVGKGASLQIKSTGGKGKSSKF